MDKAYSVVTEGGVWLVIHRAGDVVTKVATREAAQSSADSANAWAAIASTLGVDGQVPASVIATFA